MPRVETYKIKSERGSEKSCESNVIHRTVIFSDLFCHVYLTHRYISNLQRTKGQRAMTSNSYEIRNH